jgi:hypothetical protein
MESQPGVSQTSELEREDAAQRRAREEQEASRRAWAQSIVDAYDTDLAAAETAIRDASDRFAEAAVRDIAAAVVAYMDWAEASLRHYTLQVRVATVAPLVGLEATPGERLSPPPFSQALDAALDLHIAALSGRIRDEAADEIRTRLGDTMELDLGATWPSDSGIER